MVNMANMANSIPIVQALGGVLDKLIRINSNIYIGSGNNVCGVLANSVNSCGRSVLSNNQQVTKFHSSYVPEVSVLSYLERIEKYSKCSESCFIVALIYIDRIIESRNFVLSNLNVHRILITSILVSAKFLDDFFYNNAFYAKLGGITTQEMNSLELEFLSFLGFSLNVSTDLYDVYFNELKSCYIYENNKMYNHLQFSNVNNAYFNSNSNDDNNNFNINNNNNNNNNQLTLLRSGNGNYNNLNNNLRDVLLYRPVPFA